MLIGPHERTMEQAVMKYYDVLKEMLGYLAKECVGGQDTTLVFSDGKVTIKLK